MQIKKGARNPKLNRILITGGGNTGKTSLGTRFASDPSEIVFISTDGNANRQGYDAIDFVFPNDAKEFLASFSKALDAIEQVQNQYEVIAIDLIEDFDERMQTLLRKDLQSVNAQRAWGIINSFYKDAQSLLMSKFRDKTIILLSREVEVFGDKKVNGKTEKNVLVGYKPALRLALKNLILKDQDAEIRCYFNEQKQRRFDIENLRFEEKRRDLQQIINAPLQIPQAHQPAQKQPSESEKLKAKVEKMIQKVVKDYTPDPQLVESWRANNDPQAVYDEIVMFVEFSKNNEMTGDGSA